MPTSGSNNETSLCLPAPLRRRHTRSALKERKREGRRETRRERGGKDGEEGQGREGRGREWGRKWGKRELGSRVKAKKKKKREEEEVRCQSCLHIQLQLLMLRLYRLGREEYVHCIQESKIIGRTNHRISVSQCRYCSLTKSAHPLLLVQFPEQGQSLLWAPTWGKVHVTNQNAHFRSTASSAMHIWNTKTLRYTLLKLAVVRLQ